MGKVQAGIWEEAVRYHAKAVEYVHRHEWLGSYYNTRLAITACEHLMSTEGSVPSPESNTVPFASANASTLRSAADVQLNRDDLPGTLSKLRATLPSYGRRLRKFQRAFGCPKRPSDRTNSRRTMADDETGPALDCSSIQEVSLRDPVHHPPARFRDIVGNTTAKQAIEDTLIRPVLMPHLYTDRTRAILFYGPPGTGKTLLAKATAHELDQRRDGLRALFFAPTADEFKGKYVGETEEKIVRLFRCASQKARALEAELNSGKPDEGAATSRVVSVLFVDEIDSLAKRRDAGGDGAGASAVVNATNALLQVMDGMETFDNVVVLAATNYPWNIDSAVLRRFGQKIHVSLPDEDNVHALLRKKVVDQLRRVLLADGGSAARQARLQRLKYAYNQRTDQDLFCRWQTLHGVTDSDLCALAGDMLASKPKQGGYAPRDIDRMCELAFRKEAQRAQSCSEGFYPVRLAKDRRSRAEHTEHAEELLALVDGLHVSAATFRHLRGTYEWALDTDVRPESTEDQQFPQQLILSEDQHETRYIGWSQVPHSQNADAAKPGTARSDTAKLPPTLSLLGNVEVGSDVRESYHLYLHEDPVVQVNGAAKQRVSFVLYRTFRVATQRQVHDVPVLLAGAVVVPQTKQSYSLKALLQAVDVLRFVYEDRMYQTRFADSKGAVTGMSLRTSVLAAGDPTEPLSVLEEQEKWWWGRLKRQLEHVKRLATGHADSAPADDVGADAGVPVANWINRLYVKGCPKRTSTASTDTDPKSAVDVTDSVNVSFQQHAFAHNDSATASPTASPRAKHTAAPQIRCAHLTYNMQTFLDARHEVQPSASAKSVESLVQYQRTGRAPAGAQQ